MKRPFLPLAIIIAASSFVFSAEETQRSPADALAGDVDRAWMPGSINFGVKTNDAYTDGSFSIVGPVWSSLGDGGVMDGSLLFVEPYISWGERGEVASSLGLGWRHLFSDQSVESAREEHTGQAGLFEEGWALGASLFLDMLDTQENRQFWQLGTGVELLSRYVELRGNYYVPLTARKEVERVRTREKFTQTTSQTSYQTVTATEDPYATGYTIAQDVSQSVYETTTSQTTTTTIEKLFRRYEEGMEGWDAEVALLVPWIDQWMDVKVIGGYYSFDNQPFGPQTGGTGGVEGWKAGLEIRPVPALVLSASWYQDDKLTGSDWIAGFRIELPFETTNIGDGKGGFWGHIKDAFKPRRRHFAERLAEPVHRQNAAVKLGSKVKEEKPQTTVASSLQTVTRVVSQTKTQIVLASDVVFVDNTIGSASNPGTYEAPVDTIQGGENTANVLFGDNGKVFVQGGGPNYVEQVVASQSTEFYGSGRGVMGVDGQNFHGRNATAPTLHGTLSAYGIGKLLVSGFNILSNPEEFKFVVVPTGTPRPISPAKFVTAGIQAENVGQVTIIGNSIRTSNFTNLFGMNEGIRIIASPGGATSAQIIGNTINRNSAAPNTAVLLESTSLAALNASVIGNTFEGFSRAILVSVTNGYDSIASGYANVAIASNIFLNTTNSITLSNSSGNSIITASIDGNIFSEILAGQFAVSTYGKVNLHGAITNTADYQLPRYWYDTNGSAMGSFLLNGVTIDARYSYP